MPGTPSLLRLHLRYRLWIAEMNEDITVLRIFDDHLTELSGLNKSSMQTSIENFKKQFADFRTEIDKLKHEMHLQKMNLAALGRDGGTEEKINADEHAALQQRYTDFRKRFDAAKDDFASYEP
jgi:hypothetical protein